MPTESLYFNGVNGSTGEYLLDPRTAEEVVAEIRAAIAGHPPGAGAEEQQASLAARDEQVTTKKYGVGYGIDAGDLAQAGWGVIFPADVDPAVREALRPLLEHRRKQAGATKPERYKEFAGHLAHRTGEVASDFAARHGVALDMPADPDYGVPYYLLLVAPPAVIPYRFQCEMDVQYAVGRLWFEQPDGTPDVAAFARYAGRVVAAETGAALAPRRAVFFGVRNDGSSEATQLSADYLIDPLFARTAGRNPGWAVESVPHAETVKARLGRYLGGPETPALLFTASHGVGFEKGDPRQAADQGALLCQDWPGADVWGAKPIPPEFYFAAGDVPDGADLRGLVAVTFACYSAGTPLLDDYPYAHALARRGGRAALAVTTRAEVADAPFVARLPQRLLAHPRGALAVIGHVERAWGCSFYLWQAARAQTQAMEGVVGQLLAGGTVGQATEYLNQKFAAASVPLNKDLEDLRYGRPVDESFARRLSNEWTAFNDAGGYVVVGDPAVRLAVGGRPPVPATTDSLPQARSAP